MASPEPIVGPKLAVVVTAAGRSERFGGNKKELADLDGRSVLDWALSPFIDLTGLIALVVTAPAGGIGALRSALRPATISTLGERLVFIEGGPTRRDSVRLGLECIAHQAKDQEGLVVLVHDGARPWASKDLARAVAAKAAETGAALPVLPFTDTPKRISPDGAVIEHPPRSSLAGAQTPQAFRFLPLLEAHRRAAAEDFSCTDDAELWARYVGQVAWIEGEKENRKITFSADLAERKAKPAFRIGQGWDLHRLAADRDLVLGGIKIPAAAGEVAHSDGDVLLHAIIDALLGAANLGDIGSHFPPQDDRWKGADSKELARLAAALLREAGWEPVNLDCTVVLEMPHLGPYKADIASSIEAVLGMAKGSVSVKAKTSEGLNAAGQGLAIESSAIALIAPAAPSEP